MLLMLRRHQPVGDISVAKPNLSRMDFESLISLRQQVEERLHDQRATIEKQLEALGTSIASLGGKIARSGRGSTLKGKKLAPVAVRRQCG
jgi:hypothetical protein